MATDVDNHAPDELLAFWFGPEPGPHDFGLWFRASPAVDAEIRERFEPSYRAALRGELDAWDDTSRGVVAKILLLDQLPRNMFRGTAEMFAGDDLAVALAERLIDSGDDRSLACVERLFVYIALEHNEDVERVRSSHRLISALAQECAPEERRRYQAFVRYNRQHLEIVERFGRYPHRNELLGRESTEEEERFLAETSYAFMRSVYSTSSKRRKPR